MAPTSCALTIYDPPEFHTPCLIRHKAVALALAGSEAGHRLQADSLHPALLVYLDRKANPRCMHACMQSHPMDDRIAAACAREQLLIQQNLKLTLLIAMVGVLSPEFANSCQL